MKEKPSGQVLAILQQNIDLGRRDDGCAKRDSSNRLPRPAEPVSVVRDQRRWAGAIRGRFEGRKGHGLGRPDLRDDFVSARVPKAASRCGRRTKSSLASLETLASGRPE